MIEGQPISALLIDAYETCWQALEKGSLLLKGRTKPNGKDA